MSELKEYGMEAVDVGGFHPLGDRILVQPAPAEEVSEGGIILPNDSQERPKMGKILAVGPGYTDKPMTLEVNEWVMYGEYTGQEVKVNGHDLLVMRGTDPFARVDPSRVKA